MANYIISRRLQHIIQFVYDTRYPSKKTIIVFLKDKDFNLTGRTLDRDFEHIRADFGLEIAYSRAHNGYFIDEEKSVKVASFFKFLELVTLADIFSSSLKDSLTILDYVSFDDSKSFKGITHLKDILLAINQKRKLQFTHENFENNTFKPYIITPFLLKEYENRWFVIGAPDGLDDIRTFGVDRLYDLSIGKRSTLNKKTYKSKLDNFKHIVGIDFKDGIPEPISILVNDLHIKYMASLPLHSSQVIHPKDVNGKHRVDFNLIPNYEFKMQLLKIGDDVVVLSPKTLKDNIKSLLSKTLKRYQ